MQAFLPIRLKPSFETVFQSNHACDDRLASWINVSSSWSPASPWSHTRSAALLHAARPQAYASLSLTRSAPLALPRLSSHSHSDVLSLFHTCMTLRLLLSFSFSLCFAASTFFCSLCLFAYQLSFTPSIPASSHVCSMCVSS